MSLWNKDKEECNQIVETFFKNVEETFGKAPPREGIALLVRGILDDKVIEFTKQTFSDLTPQTLITVIKILEEPPMIIQPEPEIIASATNVVQSKRGKRKRV